jgi:hypothetical protein
VWEPPRSKESRVAAPNQTLGRVLNWHLRGACLQVLGWLRTSRRWLVCLLLLLASLRTIAWLPAGRSPDNANSFSPVMPIQASFSSQLLPWLNANDGGFLNPHIAAALQTLPQYVLSDLGFSTWSAQVVWLVTLYFIGSVLASAAFARLLPSQAKAWPIVAVCGVAYQLSPSLIYGLQDTAAYGLPAAYYWGIPLLFLACSYLVDSRSPLIGPLIGFTSLLLFNDFPSILALLPALVILNLLAAVLRARQMHVRLRTLLARVVYALCWTASLNLWWFLPEYQYRTQLLGTLATSAPSSTVLPNHLFAVLALQWRYPPISSIIPYQGVGLSLTAGVLVALIAFSAPLFFRRNSVALLLYAGWVATIIPLYAYALPLGPAWIALLHQSVYFNVLRNSIRFEFLYAFLFAIVFALGVAGVANAVQTAWGRLGDRRGVGHRSHPMTARRGSRFVPAFITVAAVTVLIAASFPAINGDVVVNTTYNGRTVSPAVPPVRGVSVPAFYYSARAWLQSTFPGAPKMVFPMPGTWLSAGSDLGWGYEGGSAIYESLLPPPLIMNLAGTLTQPSFPAVAASYEFAATGGPPGNATFVPMNGTIGLWSGYTGDSVQLVSENATAGVGLERWTLNMSHYYGTNGHIFTQSITQLPVGAAYISFDLSAPVKGHFYFSWGHSPALVGWYPVSVPDIGNHLVVVTCTSVPPIAYNQTLLPVSAFGNANELAFRYVPSGPLSDSSTVVSISNLTVYVAGTLGLLYYIRSLGAQLIVIDTSIQGGPTAPLENIASFSALQKALDPDLLRTFGNLSVYTVPDSLGLVTAPAAVTSTTNYSLAWQASQSSPSQYFVVDQPAWVSSTSQATDLQVSETSPDSFRVSGECASSCFLALLQNYNDEWQMTDGSHVVRAHFEINGWANAWLLNASGRFSVVIEIAALSALETGLLVSGVLSAGLVVLAVWPRRLVSWLRGTTVRYS